MLRYLILSVAIISFIAGYAQTRSQQLEEYAASHSQERIYAAYR